MSSVANRPLIDCIISDDDAVRNQSLESFAANRDGDQLWQAAEALDAFRREESNLYHRVRALFFLSAIHRYHLPPKIVDRPAGRIPFDAYEHLLGRRFLEAIDGFLETARHDGVGDAICSALAAAYHQLALQTLADQVRRSVRTVDGNRWMFRMGHPLDQALRFSPRLIQRDVDSGLRPVLCETTAVRMDVSHSAWSDIFFLGMDFPEGARVLNISVDLGVRGRDASTRPPIETSLRIIDRPVIRLVSVDLGASAEVTSIGEMFDFARDYLGLLKAAVIAAGIVPPGLEGSGESLAALLSRMIGPGQGIELVSQINDIPKGSRLAVSTNLLGSLISILMRATGQIETLEGTLQEPDRRLIAARAILGEWIGGSGGGWQDSGGVWPGIKLIRGAEAAEGDPEYGISRGRLMPVHEVLGHDDVSPEARRKLQDSLVLVHGGMAQNVGPILEMVTEHYLLRGEDQWNGRQRAMEILDEVVEALRAGDIRALGRLTTENFEGPLQTIIPWATNRFTDRLIEACRQQYGDDFWGFWMLGGMAGGGMGFLFDPQIKPAAEDWLGKTMVRIKREMQTALPFAMDPVVYDFTINDDGTRANLRTGFEALFSPRYYQMEMPHWLRTPPRHWPFDRRREIGVVSRLLREPELSPSDQKIAGVNRLSSATVLAGLLPETDRDETGGDGVMKLLDDIGWDRQQHESIREDLRSGRIGLMQNRFLPSTSIRDVKREFVVDLSRQERAADTRLGDEVIREGGVAVVTLAAGVGSRWTQGAGVCKALHPMAKFQGRHRSFLELHLAKTRKSKADFGASMGHVLTTSHLTDAAIRENLRVNDAFGMSDQVHVSTGRSIGLRLVPMVRDLRFEWEEMPSQVLDAQQQKMLESVRGAWIAWAQSAGEGNDYTDNQPGQCVHPVGHWYEVPNLIRSGVLAELIHRQPNLRYLMLHNIDTLGATVDPALLGRHIADGRTLSFEVMTRRLEDRGGGLALLGGRPRLVEGLAMPDEKIEFGLSYYNSMTTWITIDPLLDFFGLDRSDLENHAKIDAAVRQTASRLPTYVTHKQVKKRWGHGQEDVYPVAQFEKLWGDMTALPEIDTGYFLVSKLRGGQLKEPAQLDAWKRDGTAAEIEKLCRFA
ncbi:MAG: UTP--glucose-1-phosphate uridylyltransferase [Planctomycetota bacterium]